MLALFRRRVVLALFIGLVFLPNVVWLACAAEPMVALQEGLLPALIGVALLSVLSTQVWVGAALLGPLVLLSLPEAWYVHNFGRPSDAHLLGVLLESDSAEAAAFMQGLWGPLLAGMVLVLAVVVCAVSLLRRENVRWPRRLQGLVFVSALLGALVLHARMLLPHAADGTLTEDAHAELIELSLHDKLAGYEKSWPAGLPVRLASALQDRSKLRQAQAELTGFRFGAVVRRPFSANETPVIVVVIGETARPDRWQLYGYHRSTTPQLAATPNLAVFRDVISPWSFTRRSVSVILTRKPAHDLSSFFRERSFIAAFGEAGFETAWLSTQSALGTHESPTSLYAHDAQEVNFYNHAGYQNSGVHDDVLVSVVARKLARYESDDSVSRKPQLLVLHTLGSHFNYTHRYPPSFERFKPLAPTGETLSVHEPRHAEFLSNAYDNSVLFTDHVLAELIGQLRQSGRPAALLYVADHGENFFDGDCRLSGHGQDTERDFRVPMLFWWSDKFGAQYPEKVALARKHSDRPLSTEFVFDSLLDLADIAIPDEDLTQSIFSPRLAARPRWVFADGGINFDDARREPVCKRLVH